MHPVLVVALIAVTISVPLALGTLSLGGSSSSAPAPSASAPARSAGDPAATGSDPAAGVGGAGGIPDARPEPEPTPAGDLVGSWMGTGLASSLGEVTVELEIISFDGFRDAFIVQWIGDVACEGTLSYIRAEGDIALFRSRARHNRTACFSETTVSVSLQRDGILAFRQEGVTDHGARVATAGSLRRVG
jgi:hypothetical protein